MLYLATSSLLVEKMRDLAQSYCWHRYIWKRLFSDFFRGWAGDNEVSQLKLSIVRLLATTL